MAGLQKQTLERRLRYGKPYTLFLFASISAFVIVFYTTKSTLLRSLLHKEHLITWMTSTVFMYCIFWLIARMSNILDRKLPWHGRPYERALTQIGLGIVLMSYFSLKCVYFLYEKIFKINLEHSEYLERDFVVVCACIFAVNMMFLLFYLLIRDEKRSIEVSTLREKTRLEVKKVHKKKLAQLEILDREYAMRYKVLGEARALNATEIAAFYFNSKEDIPRNVKAILWDGSFKFIENISSLKSTVKPFSHLFIQINRNYVVNRYAFESVVLSEQSKKCDLYVRIPNIEKLEANSALYPMIKNVLEQIKPSES